MWSKKGSDPFCLEGIAAVPAGRELALVFFFAASADPGFGRAFPDDVVADQLQRTIVVQRIHHPKLRPHFDERQLADNGTEMLVANFAGDTLTLQNIPPVVDRDQ